MAKKTRSQEFYERTSRNPKENSGKKRHSNRSRRNRERRKKLSLLKILGIGLIIFALYQYRVGKPQVTIDKAVASIKDGDIKKQEEYFDRLGKMDEILASAYSEDDKEKEEFLKATYSNLEVKVKSEEKTDQGLMVHVEVSNIDFIDVLDSLKKEDPNFHRAYMDALEKEAKNKNKKEAKLLLKRKFTGYDIYEDKEFVNGILGGTLKNAENK